MSAFIAQKFSDRVELATDGAIYDQTGVLVRTGQKVWASAFVPLAVTGRGNFEVVADIASAIVIAADSLQSFDQTITWLIDRLSTFADRSGSDDGNQFLIGGISERDGPVILLFSTKGGDILPGGCEVRPFVLFDVGDNIFAGPVPDVDEALLSGLAFPVGAALALDSMRKQKGGNPHRTDIQDHYGIGGHIDYTVITVAGVEVQRIHEWPDVIGQPIDPFRATAAAA